MNDWKRMTQILGYKRPHGGPGVTEFVKDVLAGYEFKPMDAPDGAPLALILEVGEGSKTLFSAHLDTVHRTPGRQVVGWDPEIELFYKPTDPLDTECLGADDGAGIWLLLQMIDAAVPGVYLLHFGEEQGGVGSRGLAAHNVEFLKRFDRAVAFDRRGTNSVISHQGMGQCCSDAFAEALSDALNANDEGLMFSPDDGGTFTDTANYTEIIPECSNVSCGYDREHSAMETLDFKFLVQLRAAVLLVDWEGLPTERVAEPAPAWTGYDYSWSVSKKPKHYTGADDLAAMRYPKLLKWVKKHSIFDPDLVAELLSEALDRMVDAEATLADMDEAPTQWSNPDDQLDFDDRLDVKKW